MHHTSVTCLSAVVASPGRGRRGPTLQPPAHPLPPSAPSQLRTRGPGMRAFGQPRGPRDSDEGWVVRSNSTREVAFAWSQLTLSLTPADSGEIQAAGALRAGGARGNLSRLPRPLQGTRGRAHAGLRSAPGLDSSTASGKDTGPSEARCREPQQPQQVSGLESLQTFPALRRAQGQRVFGKEGVLDAAPAQSPKGPLAAAQIRAGRGPRRPSGSRPSPAGCGSKSQGRPSPRSDPICARAAGRLGLLPHGWSAHFSSLPGAGKGDEGY